jgi:hypothetical protein
MLRRLWVGAMKRVYLLRHAKSRRKDRSLADRDWPLAGRGGGPRARLPMISGRRGFGPSSCCAHLRSGPGRHSSVSRAPSGSGRGDLRGRADRRERGGAAALSSRAPPGGRLGWSLGVAGSGPAGLPRCSRTGVGSASVREGALALLGGNHRDGQAERLHAMGRSRRSQCETRAGSVEMMIGARSGITNCAAGFATLQSPAGLSRGTPGTRIDGLTSGRP